MAHIIPLKTMRDSRGILTVIQNDLALVPFDIKRIFWIYGLNYEDRGKHRHIITTQLLIALQGSTEVSTNNGEKREVFTLNSPDQGLILEPRDFHTMGKFTKDAILMVFASHYYDPKDYIYTDYTNE